MNDTDKVKHQSCSEEQSAVESKSESESDTNTTNDANEMKHQSCSKENTDPSIFDGESSPTRGKEFLSTREVIACLQNPVNIIPAIPSGVKVDKIFIIDNTENARRKSEDKKCLFFDDCGVWDSKRGTSLRLYYIIDETEGDVEQKHVKVQNGKCVREVFKSTTFANKCSCALTILCATKAITILSASNLVHREG